MSGSVVRLKLDLHSCQLLLLLEHFEWMLSLEKLFSFIQKEKTKPRLCSKVKGLN